MWFLQFLDFSSLFPHYDFIPSVYVDTIEKRESSKHNNYKKIRNRNKRKRVLTGCWYPPDYPLWELHPWRSLRCSGSYSFALENYPTYCTYRRRPIVTRGSIDRLPLMQFYTSLWFCTLLLSWYLDEPQSLRLKHVRRLSRFHFSKLRSKLTIFLVPLRVHPWADNHGLGKNR